MNVELYAFMSINENYNLDIIFLSDTFQKIIIYIRKLTKFICFIKKKKTPVKVIICKHF